jgi:phage shock protein E
MPRTVIAFAAVVLAVAACTQASAEGTISQKELAGAIEAKRAPIILDVRTPAEFASGHVPGAQNVPIDTVGAWAQSANVRDKDVVVYCERGPRAKSAQRILDDAGFLSARHLEGDMSAWRDAKLPCEGCSTSE